MIEALNIQPGTLIENPSREKLYSLLFGHKPKSKNESEEHARLQMIDKTEELLSDPQFKLKKL